MTITASCLCGRVGWEADGLSSPVGNCHCHTCQKAHSAPFAVTARAPRAGFRWTGDETDRKAYESSPGKLRHFCRHCGSQMMAEWVDRDEVILRLGVVDEGLADKPVVHIWTSHRAPYYDITDTLPQLPEGAG